MFFWGLMVGCLSTIAAYFFLKGFNGVQEDFRKMREDIKILKKKQSKAVSQR